MKIVYIVREESTKDRVRFYKFVNYFLKFQKLVVFKKFSNKKEKLNYKFHDICKSHKVKLIEYLYWIKGCLSLLKFYNKKNYIFFCTGIDSALPVFFFSFFYDIKFIYDCPDNLHQSKKFNKFFKYMIRLIDKKIINKAYMVIFPDIIRSYSYKINKSKVQILRNFPSKKMLDDSGSLYQKRKSNFKKDDLIIYINGWLVENRGFNMIRSFIHNSKNLDYIIIYSGIFNPFDDIKSEKLYYLGHLNSIESLSYYYDSDLVLTFYNPEIEINKLATPNKWGDCLTTHTVPVINSEILTIKNYFSDDSFFSVKYDDYQSLVKLISEIINDRELLVHKFENLKLSNAKTWDEELDLIFNKI